MFRNKGRVLWNLLAFLVLTVIFIAVGRFYLGYLDKEKIAGHIEDKIKDEISLTDTFLEEEPGYASLREFAGRKLYRDFFVIRNDSVIFYTSNQIILDDSCIVNATGNKYALINAVNQKLLSNSYHSNSDSAIIHVIGIRNNYGFTNRFLGNNFIIDKNIPNELKLTTKPQQHNVDVGNDFRIGLTNEDSLFWSDRQSRTLFLFFFLPWVMLFVLIYVLYEEFVFFRQRLFLRLVSFIADLAIVVFIVLHFQLPGFIFDLYLFEDDIFVYPGLFYGLGNPLLLLAPAVVLAWAFHNWLPPVASRSRRHLFSSVALLGVALFLLFFSYMLAKHLIFNSGFTIEISEPVKLDVDSLLGILLLIVTIIAVLIINTRALLFVYRVYAGRYFRMLIFAAGGLILFAAAVFINDFYLFLLLQYGVITLFLFSPKLHLNIYFILSMLLVSAIGYSVIIEALYQEKQANELELRSMRILNNRDRIFEAGFTSTRQNILTDSVLLHKVENLSGIEGKEADIRNRIKSRYFSNVEAKYNVSVTICDSATQLLVNHEDDPVNCHRFFKNLIRDVGKESIAQGLYFIDDGDKVRKYLAVIPLKDEVSLFVDIYQKNTPFTKGYPELLVTEASGTEWLSGYDYGIYRNESLISSYGDFSYPLVFNAKYLKEQNDYRHYTYRKNGKTLIISVREDAVTDALAGSSYLFIILGLAFFFMYFLIHQRIEFSAFSRFRSRLQISIFTILFLTFTIIGYFVFTHIGNQNNQKNITNLKELSHSILIELEHKFAGLDAMDEVPMDYTYDQLVKFSDVFFSDINLFDLRGDLVASSRQQVFDKNIISERINPDSYHKLKNQHLNIYILQEKIGEYQFLSSYFPLRNYKDEIIAYVNVPYFSKQRKLAEEISSFLTTFINIYVILTVISLFLIWIISNYITKPMEAIKKSLSQTELSRANVKINIHRNDEIGDLVREYNKMVDELEKSARKLVATERETAWREMARQVAHEIKNPLTPMKLSVQHLGRVLDLKKDENKKALERFSRNMITQIESLSEIATAFSDFAKMPSIVLEKTDVNRIIENTLELFRGSDNISFYHTGPPACYINGDEKQLQRVFINLLKNSMQALHSKPEGYVSISVKKEAGVIKIYIEDNGTGIQQDQINKIFLPNFTTKSGGTGLGLAMVRNIVNNFGGTIELLKTSKEGTVFYLEITEYEENKSV
jgi:signal transduction histidine kinase